MRIRQLKPSYYVDKALWTGLKADTREFYVALWGIADDAGWFEWDVTAIGATVYTFKAVKRREREILRHADELMKLEPNAPHLVIHPCGHAQVPKMPQHQRISAGKETTTERDRHQRGKCPIPQVPAGSRGNPPGSDPVRKEVVVGNGRVNARERETTTTEFGEQMAAAGLRGHR